MNKTDEHSERAITDPEKGRKRRGKKGKQRDQDAHLVVDSHLNVPDDMSADRSENMTPHKRSFYAQEPEDDGFGTRPQIGNPDETGAYL